MKQTECMCIKVCLYMWADICIRVVPANLFVCMCGPRMTPMTGHVLAGEKIYCHVSALRNQRGCGFRTHTDVERCP